MFSCAKGNVPYYKAGDRDLLFAGQGKYGLPSVAAQKKAHRIGKLKRKVELLEISGRLNCEDPNHMVKECKLPLNAAQPVAKKHLSTSQNETLLHRTAHN